MSDTIQTIATGQTLPCLQQKIDKLQQEEQIHEIQKKCF